MIADRGIHALDRDRVLRFLFATAIALLLMLPGLARSQEPDPVPEVAAPETQAAGETATEAQRPGRIASHARTAPPSAQLSRIAEPPPVSLDDLNAWLHYKAVTQRPALPAEARLFYRRGVKAWETGNRDEAVRLVRGAAELDPTYAAPHTTLVAWFAFRDPGQALIQAASLLEFARESFVFELWLVANGLTLVLQSLFLGLLLAGLLVVVLRNAELRHGLQERLSIFLSPRAARKWPWVFLVVPFLVGFGIAWPTVLLLGVLWPSLKMRERALFVMLLASLVAAPWVGDRVSRLSAPLRHEQAPFYGVLALQTEPSSQAARQRLERLVEQHPDDPLLHFGLAWAARQGNDLATAEQAYRRTLELWPDNGRALNNLGNVLELQGRQDEAIESYTRAIRADAKNAAAYFNLSQAHTQRFDYHAANDALAHASALNFDLLRNRQEQSTDDGRMLLVDQWVAPGIFWRMLLKASDSGPRGEGLPPLWRDRIELSGWSFSLLTLITAMIGLALGWMQHRAVPLRHCANCDRVVCRRCAERRRELALCRSCAATESRAEVADFARVLLTEHRRKTQRTARLVRTVLAVVVPGYGLLWFRRVITPALLLAVASALVTIGLGAATPYAYQPRFDLAHRASPIGPLVVWGLIYLVSILGYFHELHRAEARASLALRNLKSRTKPKRDPTAVAA